jgi:hypothetical protein
MAEMPLRDAFPTVQTVYSWQDAEVVAAVWMRWLGHRDARKTPSGADGGVDVISETALAQVKHLAKPVSRPELQKLVGADERAGRALYFFSSAGYTRQSLEMADRMGIACFSLRSSGHVDPANPIAAGAFRRAQAMHVGEEWVDPMVAQAKLLTRVGHVLDVLIILAAAATVGYLKMQDDTGNLALFVIGMLVFAVGEGIKKALVGDVPSKLL